MPWFKHIATINTLTITFLSKDWSTHVYWELQGCPEKSGFGDCQETSHELARAVTSSYRGGMSVTQAWDSELLGVCHCYYLVLSACFPFIVVGKRMVYFLRQGLVM